MLALCDLAKELLFGLLQQIAAESVFMIGQIGQDSRASSRRLQIADGGQKGRGQQAQKEKKGKKHQGKGKGRSYAREPSSAATTRVKENLTFRFQESSNSPQERGSTLKRIQAQKGTTSLQFFLDSEQMHILYSL
jgi:hypothetical protein